MKIQYHGDHSVDVPGHEGVQPGAVIDVPDDVGVSLLAAGTAYPDDGDPIAPDAPLWRTPAKKDKADKADTETAEAGKEATS
jgi:hypothetical protein